MKTLRFFILILPILVLATGRQADTAHAAEDGTRLKVVVTIAPMAEMVEGVTEDTADIMVMVPSGADPHTYEPKPSQLKELSNADVYVMLGSGLDFERAWMARIRALNRKMYVCDSGEGITLIDMEEPGHGIHRHDHGNKDPHIWLSPVNAAVMVGNIQKALSAANPDNADFYAVNARRYVVELNGLDERIRARLAGKKGRSFVVFHPAWGYFARDYGLKEIAVEAGGKEPAAGELVNMLKKARAEGCRTVFVSPQFSKRTSEVIAKEIGGSIVTVDPLAPDYAANLGKVSEELARSLE